MDASRLSAEFGEFIVSGETLSILDFTFPWSETPLKEQGTIFNWKNNFRSLTKWWNSMLVRKANKRVHLSSLAEFDQFARSINMKTHNFQNASDSYGREWEVTFYNCPRGKWNPSVSEEFHFCIGRLLEMACHASNLILVKELTAETIITKQWFLVGAASIGGCGRLAGVAGRPWLGGFLFIRCDLFLRIQCPESLGVNLTAINYQLSTIYSHDM